MAVRPPVSYPGVYVQEVPSGVRTITGVSTSIAMFVGMTARGILNAPTRVLSFAEYQRTFGDDMVISEMTEQVLQFFQNGGREAFVTRIANNAKESAVTLLDITGLREVLKVTAKDAGIDGNSIRVEVDYNTPSPEATFNLHVFRELITPSGDFQEENRETHSNLCMNPDNPRFVEKVVNQDSRLVKVERAEEILPPDETTPAPFLLNGYSMSGLFVDWSDPGAAVTAINELLGTGNKIQVRVDGRPPVPVALEPLVASATESGWETAWQNNFTSCLSASGVSVTVELVQIDTNIQTLRIVSAAEGGSVFILPDASGDAARSFHLGVDQGGIEVSGYASHRPAPTGYFARIGIESDLNRLLAFASTKQGELKRYFMTDTSGGPHSGSPHEVTFAGPDTNIDPMFRGTKFDAADSFAGSLRNVRQNLEIIAKAITGGTKNTWTADVYGHRLVLTANYGGPNSDINALVDTDNQTSGGLSASGYQIGGANQLFDHASGSTGTANVRSYSLGVEGAGSYTSSDLSSFVFGTNGASPTLEDYRSSAFPEIDRNVDLFNLLILPRNKGQEDADREEIWGPASSFCRKRRAFLLMDPRSNWETYNDVSDEIADLRIGLVKDHAAVYWPKVTISTNGSSKDIDPSGSIAGLMARIDATRGVWKAPAGVEADLRAVRGIEYAISDDENGVINKLAVNAIRVFPNGIISWGARTMDGFDNSGNTDYKYVPVRRFALFIEESLYRGLKWVVFEPNAEPLWAQIRLNAGAFMHDLFRQGAFKGEKPADAYFVKCDSETTTQNDINLGIVNIWVGFAPLKPAEFVILYLQQMAGQIET